MLTAPSRFAVVLGHEPEIATRKTADQILTEAAARAEAAGDLVAAHHLRRQAEQALAARARSLQ